MKFNLVEELLDEDLLDEKKKKKHEMGYFQHFSGDPEKEKEIFNHNMTPNKPTTSSTSEGDGESSGEAAGGGE